MKTFAWSALLWLLGAATAFAGPLEPAHVPADAKWVIHVDFEALRETAFAEKLHEQRPRVVQQFRSFLQERYGIDPQDDLHGVTLFSETYAEHTGAVVLQAEFDREKVLAQITKQPDVQKSEHEGHTLFTWRTGKGADNESDAERRTMTAALLDGERAVFATSLERAKTVVRLLEGDGASLPDDSKLVADVPDGAVVYGAAIDLHDIARRDQAFPILKQHERIVWTLGEQDGTAFERGAFEAESEEVAAEMKDALKGLVALGKLWSADSKQLRGLIEKVEITQDGATVNAAWEADAETVLAALEEVKERYGQRSQARRDRSKPSRP